METYQIEIIITIIDQIYSTIQWSLALKFKTWWTLRSIDFNKQFFSQIQTLNMLISRQQRLLPRAMLRFIFDSFEEVTWSKYKKKC